MGELWRFFKQRWQDVLITGVWLQSAIASAFTGNPVIIAVTAVGGLVLLMIIFSLVGVTSRRHRPRYTDQEAYQTPRQALVFTVGRQSSTIMEAIEVQKPSWVGLLCSRESEEIANAIIDKCHLPADQIQKEIIDPWSIVDTRRHMASLLDWIAERKIPRSAIAGDITAGTTVMSASVFSMLAERGIDCQYLRYDYDPHTNKPIPGTGRAIYVAQFTSEVAVEDQNEQAQPSNGAMTPG